ncbi:hypothetical protein [Streptomyces himalayensis]|uniref:Lipoprotein n=1 Tax=Streptomyces himalayensis subsp. himalayensis TaxID=2756131 RepID=A0A7W0DM20_9ACTN|nr:hypothetical protein [Streptomyces himalayensis]MBA2947521.1 hypothetical protein [Streptomyces himalayensis subsp. himalayensis]
MKTPRSTAALFIAALLLTGCTLAAADDDRSSALPAREFGMDSLETGPRHPKQGKWYPYDMLAHCGIKFATFGGRLWQLDQIHTNSRSRVAGEQEPAGNYVPGYMALQGPDAASFQAAGLPPTEFLPAKDEPPLCA